MNPATRAVALPPSVAANPRLGDWLRILPSGVVEIRPGKVELGQGVLTALSQVAAEELDISVARVRTVPPATGVSPDEGYTAGSLSIQHSGAAIRVVCAEASGRYLAGAAASLGVPESKLTVADGQILAPDGRSTSYWELADDALLDRAASGEYQPKAASAYHVVGTSVPRVDLPDKLTGRPRFVHDLSPDGLCYGRIVRPPSRGATLTALDATTVLALPGVLTVVRDGSFLAMAVPGRPVQVVWSRADELTWAPFGAAAVVRVAADVDAAGNVLSWQYCAVVAEVEAVREIQVRRLTIAVDAGLVINPDGAANQVEGGAVQATSWVLKEQVRFDRYGVTSDTWETYPILRFSEVPTVDVELLPGNGNPALGVGETAQGPTVAAIGNALCDALGVRVRGLPFTEENIVAAMPD